MCIGLPAFEASNLTVEFNGIVLHQFKIFHERVGSAVLVPRRTGGGKLSTVGSAMIPSARRVRVYLPLDLVSNSGQINWVADNLVVLWKL